MVVCDDCEQEMLTAASCTVAELVMRGERFPRQRAFHPIGREGRCGDCGIQAGGLHHLGCGLEPCPRCGRQLLSCAPGRTTRRRICWPSLVAPSFTRYTFVGRGSRTRNGPGRPPVL